MPTQNQANKRRTDTDISVSANQSGKRSRVSRACDQCRTAREKCDGQPICSTCSSSKRACTYTANPKKRGIQPGYIRTLELALTWLFNNSDAEVLLNQKLAREGTSSVLLGRDTKESNKLHRTWRRSKFCRDVDKLLSGQDIGEGGRSPESEDEDTDAEEAPNQEPPTSSLIRASANPPNSARIPRSSYSLPDITSQNEKLITLPRNRWRLFDIYFAYTHCWFPICEKHDVLKLSYSYPEHGLLLSASMTSSGDHAELWSILALASLQDTSCESDACAPLDDIVPFTPAHIYDVARSLIPRELGNFEIGHVKALLILALVNLRQSVAEAAWLLVGHAARIIVGLEQRGFPQTSRFRHVFAGCFLLDNLISMQLRRRPYLRISDVERVGKVYEDGLEEWQPWTGCLDSMAASSSRAPVLSLSTFNCLVEIIGIMSLNEMSDNSRNVLQEVVGRIELWKSSLPPTFEHIRTERVSIPPTPPALLLQMVYHCCCLVMFSSQSWAQRVLDLLERCRDTIGNTAVPPIINSLLEIVRTNKSFSALDERVRDHFHKLRSEFIEAWSSGAKSTPTGMTYDSPLVQGRPNINEPTSAHSRQSFSSNVQIPTPESIQIPFNPSLTMNNRPRTSSSLLDELLPDMNPASVGHQSQRINFQNPPPVQGFNPPSFEGDFNTPTLDHRNSTASRDIESFFDELASLDGAERLENQPQFMQNLGFAPDASMADLLTSDFGQFNSLISPYVQQGNSNATQLDQTHFYDGG